METELAKKEIITTPDEEDLIYKLKLDEYEDKKVNLEVDKESISEVKKELMDILFGFCEEIDTYKTVNTESLVVEEYIERLKNIQVRYNDNEEIQEKIREVSERIHNKLDTIKNKQAISKIIELTKKELIDLDNKLYINEPKFSLKEVNIKSISQLYKKLNEVIKTEDLKEITVARGRLIKQLKKEDKKIDTAYKKVAPLVKIKNILSDENSSLETVKKELKNNERLYMYFKDGLTDLDTFKEKFNNVYNKLEVQQIIFLEGLLSNQLEKHKSLLDERYQREFLDKKGNIPSLVNVLPNAVGLSVKRLANSIEELKQANNNRKKMHLIGDAVKSTLEVIGTPVIYFGKFVASNWYTMYMTYKCVNTAKEIKAEQARKADAAREQAERERNIEKERMIREGKERAEIDAEDKRETMRQQAEAQAEAEKYEAEIKAAEERFRQEELERQAQEAKDAATNTHKQTVPETKTETQQDASPDQNPAEVTPTEFRSFQGTKLIGYCSTIFDTLGRETDPGLHMTGDTWVTVSFMPADAQWHEFWKIVTIKLPYKYVQAIWPAAKDIESVYGNADTNTYLTSDKSGEYIGIYNRYSPGK